MSDTLLTLKDISISFPGVKALDGVSFSLEKGEVHALIGENGAGKSTLMKILTGVYKKDEGEIFIKGKKTNITDTKSAQDLGISIIYQEFNLFPHLTVAQNIFIKREPKKFKFIIDDAKMNIDATEIFKKIHLDINPGRKVSQLSVAEQQMVEIVKAISFDATIMIMDEPTSALTESETEELFKVIFKLKAQGVGIIYISHRLEELSHIADRVTVLRDGKFIDTVKYRDTTTSQLIGMMVGRNFLNIFPKRNAQIGDVVFQAEGLNRGKALKDISFHVKSGEVLGLAGLMGAGRTELARAVFGADPLDSGKIFIAGREVKISSPKNAIDKGIGYLTEDRKKNGLALILNVDDNIILSNIPGFCNKVSIINEKKVRKKSLELVKKLNIKTPSIKQKVQYLSGGNQQKIIICRWLCRHTDILFFDEPTRGIDVGAKYEVYELINNMAEQGKAIIIISSELPEIIGMCDRVIVMHEGRIAGELPSNKLTENRIMHFATGEE